MKRVILFLILAVSAITPTFAQTPAAPSNLFIDTALSTKNSLTIKWRDNSSNEQGFELFINGVSRMYLPANSTQYTVSGLLPNADYVFQLKAYNAGATVFSNPSNSAGGRTLKEVPSAPASLQAIQVCATSVTLFWKDSNNEEYYAIERAYGGSAWVQIYTRAANEQFFTDKNAPENTLVSYRVRAYNNGGNSMSNTITLHTKYNAAPNIPYNLEILGVDTTSITIKWYNGIEDTQCGTNKIVDTQVWISENGAPYAIHSYKGADQFFYKIEGLKKSTPYAIKLKHRGLYGESEYSLAVMDTTLGPPISPSGLAVKSGIDALGNPYNAMTWKDNSTTEDAYVVEAATDPNHLHTVAETAPNVTYFTHIPTEEGVTWYYRIHGINEFGMSGYTEVISGLVEYTKAPNAPYDLKGALSSGKPKLMWKDDSGREESFEVERSEDKGATFTKIATLARNTEMYVDSAASAGKNYVYQVRAINPIGSSAYSNTVTVDVPVATTGIADISEVLSIYPNPSVSNVKVSLTESMIKEGGVLTIIDHNNRVVSKLPLKKGIMEQELNISTLKEGIYLIVVETPSMKISKKLVKE